MGCSYIVHVPPHSHMYNVHVYTLAANKVITFSCAFFLFWPIWITEGNQELLISFGIVLHMHKQWVYTRPSPFLWAGPGYEVMHSS